jgi:hypothetical protein
MEAPEATQELLNRLTRAEDAVQRFEFIHLVKTDAQTTGLAILYSQHKRMQEDLAGFRGETTAHLGSIDTRLRSLESDVAEIKTSLAEVLRRLPEPGSS